MVDTGGGRRRMSPPRWLWIFWALVAGGIAFVRLGIDFGDQGLANVATMVLGLLGVLVSLFWFTFRSGFIARTRYGFALAAVLAVLLAVTLFRHDGFDGQMWPIFVFRFGGEPAASGPPVASGSLADLVSTTEADFPGFMGRDRDLLVPGVRLDPDWESRPPENLWRREIGLGWSGFAVVNGHAATLEQRNDRELLTLYDVATGELVWSYEIGPGFAHVLGGKGPRSTPTIDSGVVYAMGVNGKLVAVDGARGELLWQHDLYADYGITPEEEAADVAYGRSGSPLVLGDRVIIGVGGSRRRRVSLAAYDRLTGEMIWEGGEHNISMASPAIGTLDGRQQVLVVNENWVTGHDPETGAVLWTFEWPGITSADASVSQAQAVPPNRVFVSKGYGQGAALFELNRGGASTYETRELWHQARTLRTKLTNVAIRDGYVYGLSEGILECVELGTGERAWKAGRYHHGQILLVGEMLLVLTEEGEVVLVEATPERRNNVLARFQALDGHTWNTFALYGDVLLVRNGQEAAAFRLPLKSRP